MAAVSEFKRLARILLPVPSELVLYTTVGLREGLPEGSFGGNQPSPYEIWLFHLGPGQHDELHVRVWSDLHASFPALHPAQV